VCIALEILQPSDRPTRSNDEVGLVERLAAPDWDSYERELFTVDDKRIATDPSACELAGHQERGDLLVSPPLYKHDL
jgi:hypothetical protein